MQVQKTFRANTIQLTLSDRRFKKFLFASLKKLGNRANSTSAFQSLFINENLTTYNYKILQKLNQEKRTRIADGSPNFHTVYSYDGNFFPKLSGSKTGTEAT